MSDKMKQDRAISVGEKIFLSVAIIMIVMVLAILIITQGKSTEHTYEVDTEEITVDYSDAEKFFLRDFEQRYPDYQIYDSGDLTAEILENRNGKVIVERCVGIVTDSETGDGMEVWLTMINGSPELIVECDGSEIYREDILNEKDAKKTADRIYEDYLSIKAIETLTDDGDTTVYIEDEEDDEQSLIDEREDEIELSVRDFVSVVSDTGCYNIEDEVIDDLKEHFLEYMYRKWGIGIYRPMYLEDTDTVG